MSFARGSSGKHYYIWELMYGKEIIISYEDVHEIVLAKEATINRYINLWLAISFVFLLIAYLYNVYLRWR